MAVNIKSGHCSKCHKIWKLDTPSGICPLCHKQAQCELETRGRRMPVSRNRKLPEHKPLGQGYDGLDGLWSGLIDIAIIYAKKSKPEDKEDLLHDLLLTLATAKQKNGNISNATLHRIASFRVADYWRSYYKHTNGLDCGHCSQSQKKSCERNWSYGNCPKAIKLESINQPILDSEGNMTELGDLIADPETLDVDYWERSTMLWELGYPQRLVLIAYKLHEGKALTHGERQYLSKIRKREQKKLI